MRPTIRFVLITAVLLYSYGCGQKSAKLQKSVVPPDKTLFETGSDYLKKSQYIKARLAFQTLLTTYPDSDMAAESYFAMGDSFYEEGGTENLLLAENQYKNFIIFYPGHPKGPDAQMKIISLNYKMMRSPDRDQQYSHRTLQEIKKLLRDYPDSDYVPIAQQIRRDVEETLARSNLLVGQFYDERDNPLGAKSRYEEIADEYKAYSSMDDVYFRLANLWEKSASKEKADHAASYYAKIASGFPFSKYFEESKARLKLLGKPVPPVDEQLAEINQSHLKKPQGFSPLKPLIDFGKALGFVPAPDQYGVARKAIDAEKMKRAETAAPGSEPTSEPTDNIQIETVIRKDPSGATQETTTLGSGSVPAQPGGVDKSKNTSTNTKKSANNKKKKKNYNKKPS